MSEQSPEINEIERLERARQAQESAREFLDAHVTRDNQSKEALPGASETFQVPSFETPTPYTVPKSETPANADELPFKDTNELNVILGKQFNGEEKFDPNKVNELLEHYE